MKLYWVFSVAGFGPIAYVECYDPDSNEWYDASPMNLNRSALGACVIAGLENAKEYSSVSKARCIGHASSRNRGKFDQTSAIRHSYAEDRYGDDELDGAEDVELPPIPGTEEIQSVINT